MLGKVKELEERRCSICNSRTRNYIKACDMNGNPFNEVIVCSNCLIHRQNNPEVNRVIKYGKRIK